VESKVPGALTNVIDVGATDMADARAPYSNYGAAILLAAPGGRAPLVGQHPPTSGAPLGISEPRTPRPASPGSPACAVAIPRALAVRHTAAHRIQRGQIDTDHFIGSGRVNVFKALREDQNPTLFAVIVTGKEPAPE
jgi:hypothetical protein